MLPLSSICYRVSSGTLGPARLDAAALVTGIDAAANQPGTF